ncbi:MAG: hypothetical protein VKJ87_01725 [Synechococcus sp.]|nr:hypothetical protein [Synechococcus sp.]
MASLRLRVVPLERAARQLGWKVWRPATLQEAWTCLQQQGLKVVYFGKWSPPPTAETTAATTQFFEAFLNQIQPQLKATILFDCCENSFQQGVWHRDYACFWAAQADVCIASTDALAREVLPNQVGPACRVVSIGDCAEQLAAPTAFGDRPGLAWFGHDANFQALLDQALAHAPVAVELSVVTRAAVLRERLQREGLLQRFEDCFEAVHWHEYLNPPQLVQQLDGAGSVVLPVDREDPRKRYSSHNRLTTALLLGKRVYASPIPAYEPFSDCVVLADDPLGAFLMDQRPDPIDMAALQQRIRASFSPEVIERCYQQLLLDVAATSPGPR